MAKTNTESNIGFVMWDVRIMREPFRSIKIKSISSNGYFTMEGETQLDVEKAIRADVFVNFLTLHRNVSFTAPLARQRPFVF